MGVESVNSLLLVDVFKSDDGGSGVNALFVLFALKVFTPWSNSIQVQFSGSVLTEKDYSYIVCSFRFSDHWESNIL